MIATNLAVDVIKSAFVGKIKDLYSYEHKLIEDRLCERAIVFRLGARMLNIFDGCSVYSEYNKAHSPDGGIGSKKIPGQIHTYPDLIVVSDTEEGAAANKLMVEVKWADNKDIASDLNKLKWFTDRRYCYRYIAAAHLFISKRYFLLAWYQDGSVNAIERHTLLCSGRFSEKSRDWTREYNSCSELKSMLDREEDNRVI